MLTRLRKGESTIEDWNLLLLREPFNFPDVTEYNDTTRLFYSNDYVANYNYEQLIKLQKQQQGIITDSNDTIKVVLWESFIDSVREGKTYEFINFTYKVDKYGIYIGSGRN